MKRYDRYMLTQLLTLFGFFSLVLVLVYWVNRAVMLFDRLIADGHSALIFLEFSALTLPNVIRLVLPVSAFAAAVYVAWRMSSESETVVVQAAGLSPRRMARPVAAFGLGCAILMLILTHMLVPASLRTLDQRGAEIAGDVTAGLLVPGTFLHPADGVTFYLRDLTPAGELEGVFLTDARSDVRRQTYTAERAVLARTDDAPQLVMFDGLVQTLQLADRRLDVTRFDEFAFDLSGLVGMPEDNDRRIREVPSLEALASPERIAAETDRARPLVLLELHERTAQAVFALVTPLAGFAAMLIGRFSRFGAWRQVVGAIGALTAIELLDNFALGVALDKPEIWPLAYAAGVAGLGLAAALLWIGARPIALPRRARPA